MAEVKAVKNDEATVDEAAWNIKVIKGLSKALGVGAEVNNACHVLRKFFGAWRKRQSTQAFFCWLHQ
jgi:hypothetical protein